MGNDGIAHVDGMQQVPYHAVRVERNLVRGEAVAPLLEPFFLYRFDFRCGPVRIRRATGPRLQFNLVDNLAQHQLRVTDYGQVDRVLAVDILGVVGRLNHHLARRHSSRDQRLLEAGADAKYEVALGEKVVHHTGLGIAPSAEGKGMIFRE